MATVSVSARRCTKYRKMKRGDTHWSVECACGALWTGTEKAVDVAITEHLIATEEIHSWLS